MDFNFIINKNNFAFTDTKKSTLLNTDDQVKTSKKSIIDVVNKDKKCAKSNPIKITNVETKSDFKTLLVNLNINKNDIDLIKNIYLNILQNIITYTIIFNEISHLFLLCILLKEKKTNEKKIDSSIKNIENYFKNFNINLDDSDILIYDLIKIIDNKNLFYFEKYIKIQEINLPFFNQNKNKHINTDIKEIPLVVKYRNNPNNPKDPYYSFRFIKDKNQTNYSKYSFHQDREYSFYQTICQPLNVDNNCFLENKLHSSTESNKKCYATLGSNIKESLTQDQYTKYTYNHDNTQESKVDTLTNNLFENNSANFEDNIYLPKFLKKNELPYGDAVKNKLIKEDTFKKKFPIQHQNKLNEYYVDFFRQLYTESTNTWKTPEPISGNLDIDIQIKGLEKRLILINKSILYNFKLLKKKNKNITTDILNENNNNTIIKVKNFLKKIGIITDDNGTLNFISNINFNTPFKYMFDGNEIKIKQYPE